MEPLYLRRKEIGQVLSMSEEQARATLAKYGVKPVDLGRGRGHGLRWRTSAVIRVADILHAEAQEQKEQRRRPRIVRPVQGRSAHDLFAEFNREHPTQ